MTPSQPPAPLDHLPLHAFGLRILLALIDAPRHGYGIVKRVEEADSGWKRIFPANLYRRIRDLTAKGLIEETDPPADAPGDPRRRYFRITPLGREVARAEAQRLDELLHEARDKRLLPRPESSA